MLPFAASTLTIFPRIGNVFTSPAAAPPSTAAVPDCLHPTPTAATSTRQTTARHTTRIAPHSCPQSYFAALIAFALTGNLQPATFSADPRRIKGVCLPPARCPPRSNRPSRATGSSSLPISAPPAPCATRSTGSSAPSTAPSGSRHRFSPGTPGPPASGTASCSTGAPPTCSSAPRKSTRSGARLSLPIPPPRASAPSTRSPKPPPAPGSSSTTTAPARASHPFPATPTPAPSPAGSPSLNVAAPALATLPKPSSPKPSAPQSSPVTSVRRRLPPRRLRLQNARADHAPRSRPLHRRTDR